MSNKKEVKVVRYYCDYCRKDITRLVRIRCAVCSDFDLCVQCFSVGVELRDHRNNHDYFVIDTMYFPILEPTWAASEELLMLEGIETHGIGNWIDIADHFGTKTLKECRAHYFSLFIDSPTSPLPDASKTWSEEELAQLTEANAARIKTQGRTKRPSIPKVQQSAPVNHDLSGWMPKRKEFETEYGNDAEVLIADISFDEQDEIPSGKDLKLKLLEYYNSKLDQRVRLRKFVVENELMDAKKRQQRERRKTKEEKEIYMFARPFLQLPPNNIEQHEEFLKGLNAERALRQRIEELQRCRKMGITTKADMERYEVEKKKRDQELSLRKARESASYLFPERSTSRSSKWLKRDRDEHGIAVAPAFPCCSTSLGSNTTQSRNDKRKKPGQPLDLSEAPDVELLSAEERHLCSRIRLYPTQYLAVKEVLLREDAHCGFMLSKEAAKQLLQIDEVKIGRLYDFLERAGLINARAKPVADSTQRTVATIGGSLSSGGGQGLAATLRQQSVAATLGQAGRNVSGARTLSANGTSMDTSDG